MAVGGPTASALVSVPPAITGTPGSTQYPLAVSAQQPSQSGSPNGQPDVIKRGSASRVHESFPGAEALAGPVHLTGGGSKSMIQTENNGLVAVAEAGAVIGLTAFIGVQVGFEALGLRQKFGFKKRIKEAHAESEKALHRDGGAASQNEIGRDVAAVHGDTVAAELRASTEHGEHAKADLENAAHWGHGNAHDVAQKTETAEAKAGQREAATPNNAQQAQYKLRIAVLGKLLEKYSAQDVADLPSQHNPVPVLKMHKDLLEEGGTARHKDATIADSHSAYHDFLAGRASVDGHYIEPKQAEIHRTFMKAHIDPIIGRMAVH